MSISASPASPHPKFESFLNKRFVVNVSDPTLDWYRPSLKWLPSPDLTTDDLKAIVIKMREAGLKPSSVACRLRAIRSYIRWAGLQVIVPKIRIEQRELPTFGPDAVAALLKWKPKAIGQQRLSALICFLLDSGARIDELSVTWKDVNLNDCLVTLWGKGRKLTDGAVLE